mmetsp:Transcript_64123/g.88696  ORF Transcript_64123/g.88696 Transcript_64123/m.88696 type:complete len:263 (+) Transcript_64123:54-842(+)
MKLSIISACLAYSASAQMQIYNNEANAYSCWVLAYGRGVGKPISYCAAPNSDKDGLLCYPECRDNFNGVGPVCWENCPDGFRNDGAYCAKPDAYGRGTGYTSKSKCKKKEHTDCEKNGLLYYPKCRDSFHHVGCCVCSPSCPSDMHDIGVSCHKNSYGRTAGVPMTCPPDTDEDAALCYPKCDHDADGVGPVCWGHCPYGTSPCGSLLCLTNDTECTADILDMVKNTGKLAVDIADEAVSGSIIDISKLAVDVAYPECPTWE